MRAAAATDVPTSALLFLPEGEAADDRYAPIHTSSSALLQTLPISLLAALPLRCREKLGEAGGVKLMGSWPEVADPREGVERRGWTSGLTGLPRRKRRVRGPRAEVISNWRRDSWAAGGAEGKRWASSVRLSSQTSQGCSSVIMLLASLLGLALALVWVLQVLPVMLGSRKRPPLLTGVAAGAAAAVVSGAQGLAGGALTAFCNADHCGSAAAAR